MFGFAWACNFCVYSISSCGCLVLIPDVGLQSYVIQHMVCECAGKMLYTNGLFMFVAAVGARRSILTIPSPLSPVVVWHLCVRVCVCVFASMCPIFVSRLLDLPQTRLTDIIYMHTESFSKHTHTHTRARAQTGRQMDLADTQTEMWTSCFSVWMLSQTASHNYTCPCLFDWGRDRALCTHWAVGCRAMMCDNGGATLKGWVFMLPLKTHCKFKQWTKDTSGGTSVAYEHAS